MADTKKTFMLRVISALIAGLTLLEMSIYGGVRGMQVACALVATLGLREFSRIAFRHWQMPRTLEWVYWLISAAMFAGFAYDFSSSIYFLALGCVLFFVASIWLTRGQVSNENLLAAVAMGVFGLIYCVLFPCFAFELVTLDNGGHWFLLLLLIVFFGDTFAYFGGRWFGRHKMLPAISPNKTWQGAAAGLLGSAFAGSVQFFTVFQSVPWHQGLLFCLLCGVAAQSGDLLVSLVKRVAHVKDSGHIMPGHGGILDRLDGVYMACPLVYGFALYVTSQGPV